MTLQKLNVRRKMQKIRDSARGECCTMNSPCCNRNSETVVWCHSNYQEHGKGVGLKTLDVFGFYGCSHCHEWFDTMSRKSDLKEVRRNYYQRAHDRSLVRLLEKGILK